MSLPTTRVNFSLADQLGDAAPGAIVRYLLTRPEVDDATGTAIKPRMGAAVADESGEGHFDAWPNQRGRRESQYQVEIYRPGQTRPIWSFKVTVPEVGPVDLTGIISDDPFPPKSESQVALEAAQAASAEVQQAAQDVADAADQALADIGTAKTGAVQAVEDARDQGIAAVNEARDQGIGAVNEARDAAITTINGLVTQAEEARDLSQSWAEGTEPGGVGTKSSREHAEDSAASASAAEGFKDDAETAANRIPDPTGQPDGSLIEAVSGAWTPTEQPLALRSKSALAKSPFAAETDLANLMVWDSFTRANGSVGAADSGQTYTQLEGSSTIEDNRLVGGNADVITVPQNFLSSSSLWGGLFASFFTPTFSSSHRWGLVLWVDEDNWLKFVPSDRDLYVLQNHGGVQTELLNEPLVDRLRSVKQIDITLSQQRQTAFIFFPRTGDGYETPTLPEALIGTNINYIGLQGLIHAWRIARFRP